MNQGRRWRKKDDGSETLVHRLSGIFEAIKKRFHRNKMNEEIMRKAGFGKEVARVKEGKCATCGKEIDTVFEFRDKLSRREFAISGLCQECQDKTFGATRADCWKGCCLKTKGPTLSDRDSFQERLQKLVDKYGDQFATFIEERDKTVVIKVGGKEVEITKEQFKEDWIID